MLGTHHNQVRVSLSERAFVDLWLWRISFCHATNDTSWLSVPTEFPLLHRRLPNETNEERAARQAAHATYVTYGDACTTNNGIGVFIPAMTWLMTDVSALSAYTSIHGVLRTVDVNVLEFIAALVSVTCLLRYLTVHNLPISATHIHVWTDNSSCKSWMTTYCTTHPLHCCLLQIYSLLQSHYNIVVTCGHIPGILNIYADAPSRNFDVPNGASIRQELDRLPRSQVCQQLITTVLDAANLTSSPVSLLPAKSLTALAGIISFVSAPNTTL